MNILITGASGFVGKNLTAALKNIKNGNDKINADIVVDDIFLFDKNSTEEEFFFYCERADFVFHLAGINRPTEGESFTGGNVDFTQRLINILEAINNECTVMLSSSVQASLSGRYQGSEYGESKSQGEEIVFSHGEKTKAKVLVYRFPNVFGKWCRPNYNSAVATFCHNIAKDLPVTVSDESTELTLLYIDDLIAEMLDALREREHHCNYDGTEPVPDEKGRYCYVPTTHKATLGEIVTLLQKFNAQRDTLLIPEIPEGSFGKKLYSTFLSYLPEEKVKYPLKMNCDERGSFTELIKTVGCGQVSVNISEAGVTKGQHWHNSKWELFIVVSGKALIQQRKIGSDEVLSFIVSGEKIEAVQMLPGYTHSITNLSDREKLITLMWANESFDPHKPDTFYEEV